MQQFVWIVWKPGGTAEVQEAVKLQSKAGVPQDEPNLKFEVHAASHLEVLSAWLKNFLGLNHGISASDNSRKLTVPFFSHLHWTTSGGFQCKPSSHSHPPGQLLSQRTALICWPGSPWQSDILGLYPTLLFSTKTYRSSSSARTQNRAHEIHSSLIGQFEGHVLTSQVFHQVGLAC